MKLAVWILEHGHVKRLLHVNHQDVQIQLQYVVVQKFMIIAELIVGMEQNPQVMLTGELVQQQHVEHQEKKPALMQYVEVKHPVMYQQAL